MRTAIAALALASLLAGCGGSRDPNAGKVALIVQDWAHSDPGSCTKVRDAGLNGRIVTLYSCEMKHVDPEHRIAGHFSETTQHYCFAFANNSAVNVTQQHGARCAGD